MKFLDINGETPGPRNLRQRGPPRPLQVCSLGSSHCALGCSFHLVPPKPISSAYLQRYENWGDALERSQPSSPSALSPVSEMTRGQAHPLSLGHLTLHIGSAMCAKYTVCQVHTQTKGQEMTSSRGLTGC